MELLGLRTDHYHGHTVVRVIGDLDLASVPQLLAHRRDLVRARIQHLVVDLTVVDFSDCAGFSMLINIRQRIRERGDTLRVAGLQPIVARVFRLTGLHHAFALRADLGAGVAAASDPDPPPEPVLRGAVPRRREHGQVPEPALAYGPDGTG